MEQQQRARAAGTANRGVMTTLALSMMLGSLGTSIANIALPVLAEAFSAPFYHVQWVAISYLLALTLTVVIVGWLGDRHGLRRMHLLGLGIFAMASLLCGLASNLWLLIGARVLQGVGGAFLVTLTIALVRATADEERLGRSMGLLGTMSAIGTALGPSLGGVLLSAAGWRSIFLIQVPLAILALIFAVAYLPRDRSTAKVQTGWFWVGAARNLAPSLIVNLLVATVMMTTLVVGPFYLELGLGLNEAFAGLVMAFGPVISILSGVPSGRLVDALGAVRVLRIGLGLLIAGAFLLAVVPAIFGVAGYIVAICVLTPGYQLFQAANNTAVMAGIPGDRRGMVSGLLSLFRNIGLVVGASAMGAIFAAGVGAANLGQASPSAITGGTRLVFALAGVLTVVALLVSVRRPRGNASA